MDFESLVPENARLRGYVSQRSNMRYIKIVVKHFDERQRADFRNSCLGFLSEVPDLQFSAQLIQQLVFYCIQTNKWHELWFDLQGHLARFGIQVYALVTGLRCGLLSDDNVMDRVLDKRRLKDKYFKHVDKISYAQLEQTFLRSSTPRADRYKLSLALVIERIFNAPDNNVGIDMETLSIVNDLDLFFLYPWGRISYGRLIKGFLFRGHWARKFLDATKKKEKAQRSYDAFFKNVQLHVYATLRPTETERGQPHIATLVLFNDHHVPALDDLARDSVAPQFQAERMGTPKEGTSENETSDEAHDGGGISGEEEESGADESGEDEGEDSKSTTVGIVNVIEFDEVGRRGLFPPPHAGTSTSHVRPTATAGSSLTADDIQGMLLDQRILFEMRLRTVKLEIMHHVSNKFKKLKDFISTTSQHPALQPLYVRLMWTPSPDNQTTKALQATTRRLTVLTKTWGLTGKRGTVCVLMKNTWSHAWTSKTHWNRKFTRYVDITHIHPCSEDHPVPEPSTIEEVQGGHHPSPGDRDKKQDMLPTGTLHLQDTVHIEPCPNNDPVLVLAATDEVQVSANVARPGWELTTKRRRSA
ncbi:Hypothetical predicted protein [Olea europaea subsp. europaea]|uniref:DUF1985 domain-containing protein n=1 Tax=Olea europaea subsp. europaea TaxID=158383 RepID=A0A8S0QWJ8_OLEEU|nr:Hypothetical predicted protein [Olea europaea subsp. europaea]